MAHQFSQRIQWLSGSARELLDRGEQQARQAADVPEGLSVAWGLPAARRLLAGTQGHVEPEIAQAAEALAGAEVLPVVDLAGHERPVYRPLLAHLLLASIRHSTSGPGRDAAVVQITAACGPHRRTTVGRHEAVIVEQPVCRDAEDFAIGLWQAVVSLEEVRETDPDGVHGSDGEAAVAVIDALLRPRGPDGSLHPMDPEQTLDTWVYQELLALHALSHAAHLRPHKPYRGRLLEGCRHHLDNTQPDNTTNQPWAVAAFLMDDQTASFAEQQVHDAVTHGTASGSGALVSGLLLADAMACLQAAGDAGDSGR